MASENIRSCLINLIFLGSLMLLSVSKAQDTVQLKRVFTRLFDADLKTEGAKINGKPIVVVSNTNCRACVEYFTRTPDDYQFIFLLFNESLIEIKHLLATYNLKPEHLLFSACEYVSEQKHNLCNEPSPCLLKPCDKSFVFYNYKSTSKLTSGFTLKSPKLKRRLCSCK